MIIERPLLRRIGRLAMSAVGGAAFALALPPANISILATLSLAFLTLAACGRRTPEAALCGWFWGIGWALPAFWWLREIHRMIPFLLAPILALWPAVWALTLPLVCREFLVPPGVRLREGDAASGYPVPQWKLMIAAAAMAGWWIALEYSRSSIFPWNYISTTAWRHQRMAMLAAYAGSYGIGFILTMTSVLFAFGMNFRDRRRRAGIAPVFMMISLTWLLTSLTSIRCNRPNRGFPDRLIRIGAVQGDIPQRRDADETGAREALDTYLGLSRSLMTGPENLDLLVWPETAVPYALKASNPVSLAYRRGIADLLRPDTRCPMLLGTIDFTATPGDAVRYNVTNSALLLQPGPRETGRYDKIHRVPFGEFVPFRTLLPKRIVNMIDMHRDLTPGKDASPLPVTPEVRAGMAICFESVFPQLAREEFRRGANMLIVLSNDAWYPSSSEPEQHLANAVFRAVETGLPAVRCGNNGGTLVVLPNGRIGSFLPAPGTGRPEIRRGRSAGVLDVPLVASPPMTLYARYGDWTVPLGFTVWAAVCASAFVNRHRRRRSTPACGETESRPSAPGYGITHPSMADACYEH